MAKLLAVPSMFWANFWTQKVGDQFGRNDLDVWNVLRNWQVGKAAVAHILGTVSSLQMAPAQLTRRQWSQSAGTIKAQQGSPGQL